MDKRKEIMRKIYEAVVKRSTKLCNFVEDKAYTIENTVTRRFQFWKGNTKIVYRKERAGSSGLDSGSGLCFVIDS